MLNIDKLQKPSGKYAVGFHHTSLSMMAGRYEMHGSLMAQLLAKGVRMLWPSRITYLEALPDA